MANQTSSAKIGFEEKLWQTADKMRNNMDPSEYKHVILGLIFLKYISDSFEELHAKLSKDPQSDPEDKDYYMAENVFWVPQVARWNFLKDNAKKPEIGKNKLTKIRDKNVFWKNLFINYDANIRFY